MPGSLELDIVELREWSGVPETSTRCTAPRRCIYVLFEHRNSWYQNVLLKWKPDVAKLCHFHEGWETERNQHQVRIYSRRAHNSFAFVYHDTAYRHRKKASRIQCSPTRGARRVNLNSIRRVWYVESPCWDELLHFLFGSKVRDDKDVRRLRTEPAPEIILQ